MNKPLVASLAGAAIAIGGYTYYLSTEPSTPAAIPVAVSVAAPDTTSLCDTSLWNHVYAGDTRRFDVPQDRLKIIKDCVTVTGTVETAKKEADGDVHIRLKLDSQYAGMLNDKNVSGQRGDLVLEPVCVSVPTQKDTIEEHSCDNFNQTFDTALIGKHVRVLGAYVTDQEHGWNEIHPVTSIMAL